MTIAVSCSCGKRLKAPPRLAGKQARCPGCGRVLEVPSIEADDSSSAYTLVAEDDRTCPECGRKVEAEARCCDYCGVDLHTGRKANEMAAGCPVCGGPLSKHGRCPQCARGQVALFAAQSSKELRIECEICGALLYEGQACPTCAEGEEQMDAALRKKKRKKPKGTSNSDPGDGSSKVEKVLDRIRRRIKE